MQGAGAGVDGHAGAPADERGELLLEGGDLLPLDEASAAQDRQHGRGLLVADVDPHRADPVRSACSVMVPSLAQATSDSTNNAPVTGQRQRPPPSSTSRRPAGPTQPIRRAGVPTTRAKSGTSCTTTAPAATIAHRPTSTGATQTARAPTEQPCRSVTPTAFQSAASTREPSGRIARGYSSLVSTAAGPMKTPSSTTAGS